MKPRLMLLLLFLLAPALFLAEQGYTPTSFMVLGGRVEIMELTVSPTNIPQGAPIDISIVIRNDGTASTVASAEAAIYNSGNSLVANVTSGNVAIAPSQTVTITKTWDSGNTLPGLYRVVARAAYDGNYSSSVNVTFTVYAPVQPPPSGASYGVLPYPIVIPPAIKPLKGELGFVKNAVVKEILAGQGAVESIILSNTGEKNLTINLLESGVPQGWITVQPATTIVIPGETRILHLQVTAPDDAIPGNYLVRLNATAEAASAADFVILRVKKYPENYGMPIATKTINVDAGSNKTTVSMDLMNPSKNATKTITLTEKVPPSFAGAPVAFLDKPGTISSEGGERFITWEFGELAPGEIVHFSYTVGGVLDDYSTYANWYVAQMTMTEKIALADLVKIVDVATKLAPDGTSANVRASVLYVGVDPINVTMLLETPEGFEPDPKMMMSTLIPRGVDHAEFRVAVPSTIPPNTTETHMLRFVVVGDAFIVDLESPLVVKKPAAAIQSAPTSPLSLDQIVIVALISSLVSSVVVTILVFAYGKMGGRDKPGHSQERPEHVEHDGKHNKQQVGD